MGARAWKSGDLAKRGVRLLLMVAVGCSSNKADGVSVGGANVVYEAGATDEALVAMGGRQVADGKAIAVETPQPAQMLSPGQAIVWAEPEEREAKSLWFDLGRVFIGTAKAHGAPVNGMAYLVEVSAAGSSPFLRVFTTQRNYTPAADVLTAMKGAEAPLSVRIVGAVFEDNRIPEGGGPFASESIRFAVSP